MSSEKSVQRQLSKINKDNLDNDILNHVYVDGGLKDEPQTYEEFVYTDGVDTDFKLMAIYVAAFRKASNDCGDKTSVSCCVCGNNIDAERFARSFVNDYHTRMVNIKTDIGKNIIEKAIYLARRRFDLVINTILQDTIPAIQRYISTRPEKLNKSSSFPYYIGEDDKIYHQECYKNIEQNEDC